MKGKPVSVKTLFERYSGIPEVINCRGESKDVVMYGMRIKDFYKDFQWEICIRGIKEIYLTKIWN